MSSPRSSARSDDGGQAAVEFALALPIVVLVALGLIQVIVVAADQLAVGTAARAGARAASVSATPAAAAQSAAAAAVRLDSMRVETVVGDRVTVTVSAINHTDVALIGRFIGDVRVEATVTMPREPP